MGSAQRLQVVRALLSTLRVLCSVSLVLVAGFVLSTLQLDLINTLCSKCLIIACSRLFSLFITNQELPTLQQTNTAYCVCSWLVLENSCSWCALEVSSRLMCQHLPSQTVQCTRSLTKLWLISPCSKHAFANRCSRPSPTVIRSFAHHGGSHCIPRKGFDPGAGSSEHIWATEGELGDLSFVQPAQSLVV